jgi:hypothetical protein
MKLMNHNFSVRIYKFKSDYKKLKDLHYNNSIQSSINYNLPSTMDNKIFTLQETENKPLKEMNDEEFFE